MRILLWLLALFAAAVGLSLAFGFNEGYVLITLPPWRIELTLNLFIVLMLGGALFFHLLLRALAQVVRLPRSVRTYRQRRRQEKAARALREAVQQLFAGRYGHALKNAALSYAGDEAPALSALVAARAAHFLRDEKREAEWLGRAGEREEGARTARLMTEAELHVDARRFDAALDALQALQADSGRHIAALRLGLRVYRGLGRWDDVLRVARQLEKHRALSAEAAAPLKQRAHMENLRQRENDGQALALYWEVIPATERRDARLVAAAARALIHAGDGALAQRLIEQQIEFEWDSELAGLYAECRGGDVLGRIGCAEKWLGKHPEDGRLLLTLGKLCREEQLWGKAQSYFEASLAVQASQEAYLELATLFAQFGRSEESNQAYRSVAALCRQG